MAIDRPWGRIRIRRDQAQLLHRLLQEERTRLLQERDRWKGVSEAISSMNRMVALVDATREELQRLVDEKEWDLHDQSWAAHPEAADPRTARPGSR